MRNDPSESHHRIVKAKNALLLLVMLVPFIFVEILARILFPSPTLLVIPSQNFRLIYELNPLYPEINSLGMRQEELAPAALHDNFVIAVIGDSHTYSTRSAKRGDSFPARIEHHLRASTGQKNITVLNFGVPGYNMAQELEVLRSKALPLKPDLVILQYCINDEHISDYIQPKYGWLNRSIHQSVFLTRAWTQLLYSRFGKTYLYPYVEKYLPDLLLYSPGLVGTPRPKEEDPAHAPHPPRGRDQVPVRYHDFIGSENLEHDVKVFGELCKKMGIPALATGFIEDEDRDLYGSAGFQVYSFFQVFKNLDMRDYGYDPVFTDGHFLDNGSDLIGKALADFIGANFMLSKHRGGTKKFL